MTEVERFKVGQMIAKVFGARLKAAVVMPKITRLGEVAAVNRGARFLVTTSKDEALAWRVTFGDSDTLGALHALIPGSTVPYTLVSIPAEF